jgi:predicted N-formylglutamate amidohydrolase
MKKILQNAEPPPFRWENKQGAGRGFVLCDHASCRVPKALKNLGMKKSDLRRHIGWDIGVTGAGRHIARKLDMPLLLASYSRLVADLNRAPGHRECMAEVSDHIPVPANMGLSAREKKRRLDEIFWPYQMEIGRQTKKMLGRDIVPLLVAVHSFTPQMDGKKRPWDIGILFNHEKKIAKTFAREFRKRYPKYRIGENAPYSLKDERFKGSTIWRWGEQQGLPYIFVEFRQDLIDTPRKARRWANMFLTCLAAVLEDPATFRRRKIR